MFVQENIEALKREWTDKFVVVAGDRPELRRFEGHIGQVKTVNMSGRALVQFDAWANIGWYDIDPYYLQVVPKPDPAAAGRQAEARQEAAPKVAAKGEAKAAGKPVAGKPAAGKPAAGKPAAGKPAAGKPAAGKPAAGKMSVAEMLAAARANKPAATGATGAPAASPQTPVKEAPPEPAKPQAAASNPQAAVAGSTTVLPKGGRPSIAQMLAYCREHDAKG